MGVTIHVESNDTPNPRQEIFLEAQESVVAYGGARGGGKSWALRRKALILGSKYPGIKMLLLRRTFKQLEDNHLKDLKAELRGLAEYKEQKRYFLFKNGSELVFGYCDAEADVDQYQGTEYDIVFIDEATQLTEYQYSTLSACVRGVRTGYPKRIYLTCNPGGVGHEWVKRLFIDRKYTEFENPEDYKFIPAKVTDNTVLMEKDPSYIKKLMALPDGLRQAWLDGDWDYVAGRFFGEFEKSIHVIEPCELKAHWRRYVSLDYGLDMLACYWIAVDERGRRYVYRELHEKDNVVSVAAKKIAEYSSGEKIEAFLAPPDLWARQRESGRTTADIFAECGVPLTKTSNNRVHGWRAVREELRVYEDKDGNKTARLKIFRNCENLIRGLSLLQFDKKNPEDCATEPHEITHAPDALRGFCVYWTSSAEELPREQRIPIAFKYFAPAKTDNGTGYGEKIQVI